MPQIEIIASAQSKSRPHGRFGYRFPFSGFQDLTNELSHYKTKEDKLNAVINKLLAEQRQFALDHERGGEMFHGAALIETKKGRWFLQANIHLANAETTRNCAEANAGTEARGREGEGFQIKNLWFMGGKANYEAREFFINNKFQRNAPCGSCLDIIFNNRLLTGDTLVHMLPLNDGTAKLIRGNPDDASDIAELPENQILTRRISDLLPHIAKHVPDFDGTLKKTVHQAYAWIKSPGALEATSKALLDQKRVELQHLEGADEQTRYAAINRALMEAAKDYYQDAEVKPHTMSVAIVRTQKGEYYIGRSGKNGVASATSTAIVEAMEDMSKHSMNNRLTDVFFVDFSETQLAQLSKGEAVSLPMPDGATRERIKKNSPRNGEAIITNNFLGKLMGEDGATVHAFLPNNPELNQFDSKKHVIKATIRELLPYAYNNPKGSAHEGCQHMLPFSTGR